MSAEEHFQDSEFLEEIQEQERELQFDDEHTYNDEEDIDEAWE